MAHGISAETGYMTRSEVWSVSNQHPLDALTATGPEAVFVRSDVEAPTAMRGMRVDFQDITLEGLRSLPASCMAMPDACLNLVG